MLRMMLNRNAVDTKRLRLLINCQSLILMALLAAWSIAPNRQIPTDEINTNTKTKTMKYKVTKDKNEYKSLSCIFAIYISQCLFMIFYGIRFN